MDGAEKTYRIDRSLLLGELPLLAILLADLAFGLWALPRLPERVPVHWNAAGEADAFGASWPHAVLPPLVGLTLWTVVLLLPLVDPLRRNYARFPGTLKLVRWLLPLMCVAVHMTVTLSGLGLPVDDGATVRAIVAVFFVVFGNSMAKLRHNWFVGIRTPWTIASEEVWTRTHRLAAPIWVTGGLVQLVGALLPGGVGEVLFPATLAAMVVVPIGYSLLLFRTLNPGGSA
ncbi:MAG TPA: SdpI family protein [Thermoanaerobaculia bacterium]|nr:SdpI family protein [Thermoanaerobaculia bacterium]HQN09626.1 SdpI family protein [Thermoanaerobaculia bacterium]HQP87147.1 SdpI family protein [Thermoanaerobaculia bacterium]